MTWLDYSFARPPLAHARSMGATGVLRYLSPVTPQTQGKILTAGERDQIFGADLDLALNFEWYEGRCLEGGAAGRQDAATALTQARALGYPPKRCIYFSHDTGQWTNAVLDYFDGVNAGLAGYYEAGGYGGYGTVKALLDAGKIKRAWQTIAWSNGQRDPRAVLFQNGRQWFGNAADENEVTGSVNGWRGISSGDSGLGGGVPITSTTDWFDMATAADLENAVRKVLNEGTAKGTNNWAETNQAIFGKVGQLINEENQTQASLGAVSAKIPSVDAFVAAVHAEIVKIPTAAGVGLTPADVETAVRNVLHNA